MRALTVEAPTQETALLAAVLDGLDLMAADAKRLASAVEIHEQAALSSASWGLFQVMGYHYDRLGYDDVKTFVSLHEISEKYHLEAFGRYLVHYNLIEALRGKDWPRFAKGYNGPSYAENQYDVKLEEKYRWFRADGAA